MSSGAAALEGTHGIDAAAPLAQARDGLTLIHICKGMRGPSEGRTKAARDPIQPWPPRPSSLLADSLTLTGPRVDIGDEASATGVRLCRTELTRDTPGLAHGGTAECFGAHEADQLVPAPLRAHLTEAGPRPIVCETG